MTQGNRVEHVSKIEELAERYTNEGYEVEVEPGRASLPFDLGSYEPDLVARKGSGGLIVEVKSAGARTSIERYQAIARTVQDHPGWRFLLVTVEDLNIPISGAEIAAWGDLKRKLAHARTLIDDGNLEPAVLYLWSIFEAAMRKVSIATAMPIERLPATKLLNHLYTAGMLSVEQFDLVKAFLNLRNRITHGFNVDLASVPIEPFYNLADQLIPSWQLLSAN